MKKIILTLVISIFMCLFFAACSASEPEPSSDAARENQTSDSPSGNTTQIEVIDDTYITDQLPEDVPAEMPDEIPDKLPDDTEQFPGPEDNSVNAQEQSKEKKNAKAIVWLGDSLTQGSLGGNNDNLPNAPYEKLKHLVNVPVEGYGIYGACTHDIFWLYLDEGHYNQEPDPDKVYVFWVGSNDWVADGVPNTDTSKVIGEIDTFIKRESGVKNYIVIGTTSRYELGDMYIPINKELSAHYGNHYMDVIDIINKYGYSSDNIHLSQESYDAIAAAVYDKLKSLGYI